MRRIADCERAEVAIGAVAVEHDDAARAPVCDEAREQVDGLGGIGELPACSRL